MQRLKAAATLRDSDSDMKIITSNWLDKWKRDKFKNCFHIHWVFKHLVAMSSTLSKYVKNSKK